MSLGTAVTVWAQEPGASKASRAAGQPTWEIEGLGGLTTPIYSARGTSVLPAAGPTFTSVTGQPTRQIASWLFGDGTALSEEFRQYLFQHYFTVVPSIPPLDALLTTSQTTGRSAFTVGARLTRHLTGRLAIEGAVQVSLRGPALATDVTDAAEATRAGYVSYFNVVFGAQSGAPFLANITATKKISDGSQRQVQATGALVVTLVRRPHDAIYVVGGGGLVAATGTAPFVSVTGRTTFTNPLISLNSAAGPIDDTDAVMIQYTRRRAPVFVAGGGFRHDISARMGVKIDVRDVVGGNKAATILNATPAVVVGSPAGFVATYTVPSLQFSGSSIVRDNLSLAPVTNFRTFSGTARLNVISLTAGMFVRF